jgi:GMP synthase (glutamine-hydrolysing)
MKPVLVLQQLSADGPAFLATWLQARGLAFEVRNSEAGDAFPADVSAYRAVALLGGEMGANDDLPALRHAEWLVRQAVGQGVPVLGHCLGGQLMARALGACVVAAAAPEIGWQTIAVHDTAAAADWLGAPGQRTVFQWHFDTFELPPGAQSLAGSAVCPHQAFAFGPHLALQFHVEIDEEKLGRWVLDEGERYRAARLIPASVQSPDAMLAGIDLHLRAQQAMADRLYRRWLGAVGSG